MDEFIKSLLERLPDFGGLLLLAYILYQQNNRLMDTILQEIDALKDDVEELRINIHAQSKVK